MLLKCLMCIYNSWGFFWECLRLLQWSVSKCRYNMGLENATEATAGLTLEKVVPVRKALWPKLWHHICMYWHVQKNAHQKKKKRNQLLLRIQISSLVLEKLYLEIQSHLFGKVNVETVLCFHSTVLFYGFFFPFTTV